MKALNNTVFNSFIIIFIVFIFAILKEACIDDFWIIVNNDLRIWGARVGKGF